MRKIGASPAPCCKVGFGIRKAYGWAESRREGPERRYSSRVKGKEPLRFTWSAANLPLIAEWAAMRAAKLSGSAASRYSLRRARIAFP